jgi:hypothetical protein
MFNFLNDLKGDYYTFNHFMDNKPTENKISSGIYLYTTEIEKISNIETFYQPQPKWKRVYFEDSDDLVIKNSPTDFFSLGKICYDCEKGLIKIVLNNGVEVIELSGDDQAELKKIDSNTLQFRRNILNSQIIKFILKIGDEYTSHQFKYKYENERYSTKSTSLKKEKHKDSKSSHIKTNEFQEEILSLNEKIVRLTKEKKESEKKVLNSIRVQKKNVDLEHELKIFKERLDRKQAAMEKLEEEMERKLKEKNVEMERKLKEKDEEMERKLKEKNEQMGRKLKEKEYDYQVEKKFLQEKLGRKEKDIEELIEKMNNLYSDPSEIDNHEENRMNNNNLDNYQKTDGTSTIKSNPETISSSERKFFLAPIIKKK